MELFIKEFKKTGILLKTLRRKLKNPNCLRGEIILLPNFCSLPLAPSWSRHNTKENHIGKYQKFYETLFRTIHYVHIQKHISVYV